MRLKLVLAVLVLAASPVRAETFTVMTSGAFTPALKLMAADYEKQTGNHIDLVLGTSAGTDPTAIPVRLANGEKADMVILASGSLDGLIAKGLVIPPGRLLAVSKIAMAVKAGAPVPDISTVEAFKKTLLAARSVVLPDSAGGVYIATDMYKKMGIADQMTPKSHKAQATASVGVSVARGDADIGFQTTAELMPVQGIKIVGDIPDEVQNISGFSAGIVKASSDQEGAKALFAWLMAPERDAAIRASGLLLPASGK